MLRSGAMKPPMKPLADCPKATLAAIRGVLTDIDETVSTCCESLPIPLTDALGISRLRFPVSIVKFCDAHPSASGATVIDDL